MIDSRKLKVYLDTSVISYLQQEDAPEKTRITLELYKHLVNVKTIDGVRALSMIKGYKNINILNPMTLLEMEV